MHGTRRRILMDCFKVFDLVLMLASYAAATLVVLQNSSGTVLTYSQFIGMRVKIENFVIFTGIVISWHIILFGFGLYHSKRLTSHLSEIFEVFKATTFATAMVFAAGLFFKIRMINPAFILTFWAATSVSIAASRLALRLVLQEIRKKGRNLRWMLIAGTNQRAIEFAKTIDSKPELGYRILGFADDEWAGIKNVVNAGYQRVCGFEDFKPFLRNNVVDELVIALPIQNFFEQASQIAAACEEQGIAVRHLAIFQQKRKSIQEGDLDYSLITHYSHGWEGAQLVVKRLLDIAVSFTLLALTAPLCALVTVLVKLTSPGPVFFVQKRLGVNKRRFNMYKFRTMVADAEQKQQALEHLNEASGSVFKIKDDPRITPIGKFLRKTSIDELPQLLNVLKGDMSLVGPRPLPNRDYDRFDQDWQRRRFSVRPGITCLWQINGRSSIEFEEWMRLDLSYIDEWSLWLDLRILIKTVPAVLRGSGAV